jgi:hypothetical protein
MAYLENFDASRDIFVYSKLEHELIYRSLGWEDLGNCYFPVPTTGHVPYSLRIFLRRGAVI